VIFGEVDSSFAMDQPTLIYKDNRAAILTAEAECSTGGRLGA
jgi:hypothetical protein